MLTVTSFYAALLAVVFLWLSVGVIRYRRANRISVGDNGDSVLLTRMRGQGNFAEYAPFGLLLLCLAELQGLGVLWLHGLGLLLLGGRVLHGIAFSSERMNFRFRVFGMGMTLGMIALAAVFLLISLLLPAA